MKKYQKANLSLNNSYHGEHREALKQMFTFGRKRWDDIPRPALKLPIARKPQCVQVHLGDQARSDTKMPLHLHTVIIATNQDCPKGTYRIQKLFCSQLEQSENLSSSPKMATGFGAAYPSDLYWKSQPCSSHSTTCKNQPPAAIFRAGHLHLYHL